MLHSDARMYALNSSGQVRQIGHPREVQALADPSGSGNKTLSLKVLVLPRSEPKPDAALFDAGTLPPGALRTTTSTAQAYRSHEFPVSDQDRARLGAMLAHLSAGYIRGLPAAERSELVYHEAVTDEQRRVMLDRYVALARTCGVLTVVEEVKRFTEDRAGRQLPPTSTGFLLGLVERRLRERDLASPTLRAVSATGYNVQDLDGVRLNRELTDKLKVKLGERPACRIRVSEPSSTGAISHAEMRFLYRSMRAIPREVFEATRSGTDRDTELAVDDELAHATLRARNVLAELVSNPVYGFRFATDPGEVSGGQYREFERSQAPRFDRVTLVGPDPFCPGKNLVIVAGLCEDRRLPHDPEAVTLSIVTCYQAGRPADLGETMPLGPNLAAQPWNPAVWDPELGEDPLSNGVGGVRRSLSATEEMTLRRALGNRARQHAARLRAARVAASPAPAATPAPSRAPSPAGSAAR
jgi:hypothetical protein